MSLVVGLTGGIGSGKTFVSKLFQKLGIPVYIADDRAKAIMDRPEVVQQVQALFGVNVIIKGKLDRVAIRKQVFDNQVLLDKLNTIVHPLVKIDFEDWLTDHEKADFVLKESAILFEKGLDKACDFVILVTAPEELKIRRVMQRDGVSREDVSRIMAIQMKDDEKVVKSDYIIANSEGNFVIEEVKRVFEDIKIRKK